MASTIAAMMAPAAQMTGMATAATTPVNVPPGPGFIVGA